MPRPYDPRLAGRAGPGRGAAGASPNRYPSSTGASLPRFPAGSQMILVQQPPAPVPPMPMPRLAGPYEQDSSLGPEAMVQTQNVGYDIGLVSTKIAERNTARKAICITNPSGTLTIFLNFAAGQATNRMYPLLPGNSIQLWSGEKQYVPKDEIHAIASGAGPTVVNVTEFS